MLWEYLAIFGVLIAGVVLAFPMAIGLCTALGAVLCLLDHLTTVCPGCGARRKMACISAIRTSYPNNCGTGRFYQCKNCQSRWLWSDKERVWQDASSADFDCWYAQGAPR